MRVLLLGSGGREHALAWKLAQSPLVTALGCAPGNPGIEALARVIKVELHEPSDVVRAARDFGADLVVVGPELPLVRGAVDALSAAGILTFGPTAQAAALEGSKSFAKEVMEKAKVPTAAFRTFSDLREAEAFARQQGPLVVKADGLAAGKGVVVASTTEEAVAAVRTLGASSAGATLVLEERLEGEEVSVIALCDGENYVLLSPAQDHKRVGEGDTGPNTGGMGAYTPVTRMGEELLGTVGQTIVRPMLQEMQRRGTPFRGALYAGLMITPGGPKVIEFNCRLGDPEAQVLMMQLEEDLLPLLVDCAKGALSPKPLRQHRGSSVGVVISAEGYPASARTGDVISGIGSVPAGVLVFHAGTARRGEQLVTAGGRVLTVCARAETLEKARELAYAGAGALSFPGSYYRRDIAARGLEKPTS
jgi:phosphoribosylamine--glycine ligase